MPSEVQELVDRARNLGFSEGASKVCDRVHIDDEDERDILVREIWAMLRPYFTGHRSPQGAVTMDDYKRAAVENAMKATDGNKTRAAAMLEVNVKTLYNLLRKWGQL